MNYPDLALDSKVKHFFELNTDSDFIPTFLDFLSKAELDAVKFLNATTTLGLCKTLQVNFKSLQKIIDKPIYRIFLISKKKGGHRQIAASKGDLKKVQMQINNYLQAYYYQLKPQNIFGFTKKFGDVIEDCNIVENAKLHIHKKQVLNIDLKEFFPSIKAYRVKELFMSDLFKFDDNIATTLTLLTTFLGHLPTGAPSSPIISNFICLELDKNLSNYSQENGLTYSRYADDLTFSSDNEIDKFIIDEICIIIRLNNFVANNKKIWLKSSNRRQTVTGLVVNEKVNVDRRFIRKVRAMLYEWGVNGLRFAAIYHYKTSIDKSPSNYMNNFLNKLWGYINFIGQVRGVNDSIYLKFKGQFNENLKSLNVNIDK